MAARCRRYTRGINGRHRKHPRGRGYRARSLVAVSIALASMALSESPAASTPAHRAATLPALGGPAWRSGVFAGYVPSADMNFGKWRGGRVQTATDYMPSVTWSQIANPQRLLTAWRGDQGLQLVLSVPMWPLSGGDMVLASEGAYNDYFKQLAQSLVAAGRADTIVRIAWEFNTSYFRWSVTNAAQAKQYAEAWRQIVTAMRSAAGEQFSFVWNPDLTNKGINPAAAYPGDDYVTDIGLDVYDRSQSPGATPQRRWHDLLRAKYGLAWQARFAARHGKALAFPEWGLVDRPGLLTAAGGDDPYFIAHMHHWFITHDTDFEDYFDFDPLQSVASFAITNGEFPKAAAVYRRLFAATR